MPPVGFEPTISAGERPKTYALDRAATGTGLYTSVKYLKGNYAIMQDFALGMEKRKDSQRFEVRYN